MHKSKKGLFIFGLSTTAKAISTFVTIYNTFEIKGFIVDIEYKKSEEFCGKKVIGFDINNPIIEEYNPENDLIFIAIQWNNMNADRRNVYDKFKELGFKFANIISPSAIIHGTITGDNCWISDLAVIDTHSIIGSNVFIKTKAFIGNDCIIENHCFIGASSFIAGNCIIREQAFIGINATIFDSVIIGKKCLIGGCTVINRNTNDYTLIKTSISQISKAYDEKSIEAKLNHRKNVR